MAKTEPGMVFWAYMVHSGNNWAGLMNEKDEYLVANVLGTTDIELEETLEDIW